MTYAEAITDILSRVDDPNGDTYETRAKQLFRNAVISLAISNEVSNEDILTLLNLKTEETPTSGKWDIYSIFGSNLLRIVKIYAHPYSSGQNILLTETDIETWNQIRTDDTLEPIAARNEVRWCKIGKEIHFYNKYSSYYSEKHINVIYITRPGTFSDSDELIGDYSELFINMVMDMATANLKKEILMENG